MREAGGEVKVIPLTHENQGAITIEHICINRGSTNENIREEMRVALKLAIKNDLTTRQRQVLLLYYNGMTQKEIANKLKISQQSVSCSLNAAHNNIKKNDKILKIC